MQKIVVALYTLTLFLFVLFTTATVQTDKPSGQIAFMKSSVKNAQTNKDICIINLEDLKEKCIADNLNKDEYDPTWSPDGKILAYQAADLPLGDGKTETHLYDVEEDQVTILPTNWFIYSWSPDGTRFVTTDYYDKRSHGDIALVRLGDYQVERLTNNDAADLQPSWSPDGNKITFLSGFPDSSLMLMSSDGSSQEQLTSDVKVNNEVKPVWSPDGKQIAFVVNGEFIGQDQTSEIYIINADGSNLRQLTKTGGATLNPQWSPDGKQLVFYGYAVGAFDDVGSTTSLRTEVFRINADGSDLTDLTQNTGLDAQPSWSPDGNWIAFTSTRRWEGNVGVSGIFIMRPDGTDVRMLTNEPPLIEGGSDANYPVWKPEPTTP